MIIQLILILAIGVSCFVCATTSTLPNIIIILADDLGWNDVSFHGSDQFMTPNIDALAFSGVILKDYYTQPICTPARAALLTARHPIHNGMQHSVIYANQPWGLPLDEVLMPQHMRALGYRTHAVGKWHLGSHEPAYTPTRRGFDSFYGSWLGHQDHFTHLTKSGYDFHRDMNTSWEAYGRYTTDLLTEEAERLIDGHEGGGPLFLYLSHLATHAPVQAPASEVRRHAHIPGRRRKYAAMVTKLDESVGRTVEALRKKGMLENSIILFLSDNGGATNGFNGNVASNYPLRGGKDTLWEGGVRGVGLIWSPLLQNAPRVHRGLVNVQDWLPTLLTAIGANSTKITRGPHFLDGVCQWAALNNRSSAPYERMLHNVDPLRRIASVRVGKWKLVTGRTYHGKYDYWYNTTDSDVAYDVDTIRDSLVGRAVQNTSRPLPDGFDTIKTLRSQSTVTCGSNKGTACEPHIRPCLFDIEKDPCERRNVAASHPRTLHSLRALVLSYRRQAVKPNNRRGS